MLLPTGNSARKSVIWNAFITDGKNYKNKKSYYNIVLRIEQSTFSISGRSCPKNSQIALVQSHPVHHSTLIWMDLNQQHEQARPVRKKHNFSALVEDELDMNNWIVGHLPVQDVLQAAQISAEDVLYSPSFAGIASDLINHSTIIDSETESPPEDSQTAETAAGEEYSGYSMTHIPIPLKRLFNYTLTSKNH